MSPNKPDIEIGISSCLLGHKVRYDGGHKHDQYITDILSQYFKWVPVCPETECGLPVPREAMHLTGNPAVPRLVTVQTGIDHTESMKKWTENRLDKLADERLCGFIFKSRSPSCGIQDIMVFTGSGMLVHEGIGIFAAAFMKKFPLIPVLDNDSLYDQVLRENFIEQVLVFNEQKEFYRNSNSKSLYPPAP